MAKPGTLALNLTAIREVKDLYVWGMQVWMICAFYGIHKRTLGSYLQHMVASGWIKRRPSGQSKNFTSNPRRLRAGEQRPPDPFEDAYLIVREHARVLRHTRTVPRPADASIRSYRAAVCELQHASEHSDTRRRGPG